MNGRIYSKSEKLFNTYGLFVTCDWESGAIEGKICGYVAYQAAIQQAQSALANMRGMAAQLITQEQNEQSIAIA